MKKECLFLASALLAASSVAEVTHMSESKGMRIPHGSFTQFRLAGEGLNDDNLKSNIMQVEHEIVIKGNKTKTVYGTYTDDNFDVLVFDADEDYNCYIEKSRMWAEHRLAEKCDFVDNKPYIMFEKVTEWSSTESTFLSKDVVNNEILVVLDNTGYISRVKMFDNPKKIYHDVTYDMHIKTVFAANDLYNKTFLGFMVTMGILFAMIVLMGCLYRMQKKAHGQVLQTKKELKRINLQKMYKDMKQGEEGVNDSRDDQDSDLLSQSESKLEFDEDDDE